tara:strand:- start:202 stop:417 length:216 start_codon:yes stop_codon:yes gene_type:complete
MEIEILELENIIEVQQIKEFLQVKPKLLDMFETVLALANHKLQEKEPIKKRLVSDYESSSSDDSDSDSDSD